MKPQIDTSLNFFKPVTQTPNQTNKPIKQRRSARKSDLKELARHFSAKRIR